MLRNWVNAMLTLQDIVRVFSNYSNAALNQYTKDQIKSFAELYCNNDFDFASNVAHQRSREVKEFINNMIEDEIQAIQSKGKISKRRGQLTFTSNFLDVTDPCYDNDAWCRIKVPIEPGTYNYEVRISNEGMWGDRVKEIRITKKEAGFSKITYGKFIKGNTPDNPGGTVGVDSGTAGFFEDKPVYNKDGDDSEWTALYEFATGENPNSTYPYVVEGHVDNPVKCEAIYTSSGYGDGSYYVKELLDKNKQRCGYALRFF